MPFILKAGAPSTTAPPPSVTGSRNTRGRVEVWDSGRFFHREDATIVEWRFRCVMNDGAVQTFDGLSLVEWTQEGTIRRLQEFGCNLDTYDPYRNGDPPMFREERALWF